jgi:hypothetical protein
VCNTLTKAYMADASVHGIYCATTASGQLEASLAKSGLIGVDILS